MAFAEGDATTTYLRNNAASQLLGSDGAILVNAILTTFLISIFPHAQETWSASATTRTDFPRLLLRTIAAGVTTALVCAFGFAGVMRAVYGDESSHAGHNGFRFRPQTEWHLSGTRITGSGLATFPTYLPTALHSRGRSAEG